MVKNEIQIIEDRRQTIEEEGLKYVCKLFINFLFKFSNKENRNLN